MLVRIIAKQPVRYSLTNGLNEKEYDPGLVYELPLFAAEGMIAHGWARAVTDSELLAEEERDIELPALPKDEQPTKSQEKAR